MNSAGAVNEKHALHERHVLPHLRLARNGGDIAGLRPLEGIDDGAAPWGRQGVNRCRGEGGRVRHRRKLSIVGARDNAGGDRLRQVGGGTRRVEATLSTDKCKELQID